jgi:ribonuclease P protein component
MERLRRRAAFKAVAGGRRVASPGFVLQALKPGGDAGDSSGHRPPRIGFTVTKKIGNAVVRNRIRRRLKAAARAAAGHAEVATDYVIVARRGALTLHFQRLVTDLMAGFDALSHGGKPKMGPNAG